MATMQTLYSSTFLTLILAFLLLLGQSGQSVTVVKDAQMASFATIIEPIGPALDLPDQKVKVEVFNSFGCKDCNSFGLNVLPKLYEQYATHETVSFYLYLVPDMENEGELYASKGAHCAAEHERFWDMVAELHRAEVLNRREVDITGQGLHLPITEFRSCLQGEGYDERINQDINYATQKGVAQKPTILVNGTVMLGNQPLENIEREVNKYLK